MCAELLLELECWDGPCPGRASARSLAAPPWHALDQSDAARRRGRGRRLPVGKVTKQTLLYRGFIGSVGLIRSISVLNPATVNNKVLGGEGLPPSVLCCSN